MNYPTLFSPIQAGRLSLKNRIMHAAITTSYTRDGTPLDSFHNYYANRARGGAAAIILEPSNVLSSQKDSRRLKILGGGRHLESLKRLVEVVEAADCRFLAQLQDNGRGRREQGRSNAAIGASALPDDLSWTVPHMLQTSDIEKVIDEFTQSCRVFENMGFAGVELSAGHGHLFHQFLSPWSNTREDEYGGDTSARTLFVRQLVASIRSACTSQFSIGIKLPGADTFAPTTENGFAGGISGGLDYQEAKAIATDIAKNSDIDYWTFAWGSHSNTLHEHLPDAHGQPNPYMEHIRDLRQVAPNIPTGALGYMTDPNQAEKTLVEGTADIAMLGRPLITDPNWPNKVKAGKEADIRYCVSCNTCWHTIIDSSTLYCDNNPRLGSKDESSIVGDTQDTDNTSRQIKNITVVGSGAAGMEAAWTAAAKGHKVTVFGASDEVGGKTRLHALLPGGENLSSVYDYQLLMSQRYDVKFKMNVLADEQAIVDSSPDEVILATGSKMRWPRFLPKEYEHEGFFLDLRSLMSEMIHLKQKQPGKIVIYDQDHTEMTYDAAEKLAELFEKVIIVTPRERIGSDVSLVARQGIYRRLSQLHVEIITLCELDENSEFEEGKLTARNIYNNATRLIDDVSVLTYSTSRVPNDELLLPLQEQGLTVHTVGDAYAPRSLLAATQEGYIKAKQL